MPVPPVTAPVENPAMKLDIRFLGPLYGLSKINKEVVNKIKTVVADFLQSNQEKNVTDITIACYGLSFKPDIDDLRESPALRIYMEIKMIHAGLTIAVEPNIKKYNFEDIKLVEFEQAVNLADIHVLLVDHHEFKKREIKSDYIIDTKGIWQSN